jgi:hypothetical protein
MYIQLADPWSDTLSTSYLWGNPYYPKAYTERALNLIWIKAENDSSQSKFILELKYLSEFKAIFKNV